MRAAYDAIVVGAGPAGAASAILLARAGWRVALVEKQPFPRRKVCGECIAASNLPLLAALGIGERFDALAGPALRQVAWMHRDGATAAPFPPYGGDAAHPHAWGRALGREHLDTLLAEEAVRCGVDLLQPWTVRRVDGGPGHYVCHASQAHGDDAALSAPVLIAAHGSWEPGPALGAARAPLPPQLPSDLFAFKANFLAPKMPAGLLPILSFPGGYGGMVLGDHDIVTLAFCIRRDTLAHCRTALHRHKAAEAALMHVAEHCGGVRDMLDGATLHGAWLGVGPLRPGIRLGTHDGPFLVGNAAGEAHPIVGEGISMAIQSAFLLADTLGPLREDTRDPVRQRALQRDYAAAWCRRFAPRMRWAALFAQAAMRPWLALPAAALLRHAPGLLTRGARWSGKVRGLPASRGDEGGEQRGGERRDDEQGGGAQGGGEQGGGGRKDGEEGLPAVRLPSNDRAA